MSGEDELTLRAMVLSDLEEVLSIEKTSFPDPWTRGMFEIELDSPSSCSLVLGRAGKLIAYGCIRSIAGEAHLMNLAVLSGERRKGYGRRLAAALFSSPPAAAATKVFLEVGVDNEPALTLYRHEGFSVMRTRKDYYGRGRDAFEMVRENL